MGCQRESVYVLRQPPNQFRFFCKSPPLNASVSPVSRAHTYADHLQSLPLRDNIYKQRRLPSVFTYPRVHRLHLPAPLNACRVIQSKLRRVRLSKVPGGGFPY